MRVNGEGKKGEGGSEGENGGRAHDTTANDRDGKAKVCLADDRTNRASIEPSHVIQLAKKLEKAENRRQICEKPRRRVMHYRSFCKYRQEFR